MRRKLLNIFFKLMFPILKIFGQIYAPWSRKLITYEMAWDCYSAATPGDIILRTRYGEFSNILIAGKYKHVAMVYDHDHCIHSVTPVVSKIAIYDYLMQGDKIALVRPKGLLESQRQQAAEFSKSLLGKPYDFNFNLPSLDSYNEALYCSELPHWCYMKTKKYTNYKYEPKEILGQKAIHPDDYLNQKYFETIREY